MIATGTTVTGSVTGITVTATMIAGSAIAIIATTSMIVAGVGSVRRAWPSKGVARPAAQVIDQDAGPDAAQGEAAKNLRPLADYRVDHAAQHDAERGHQQGGGADCK